MRRIDAGPHSSDGTWRRGIRPGRHVIVLAPHRPSPRPNTAKKSERNQSEEIRHLLEVFAAPSTSARCGKFAEGSTKRRSLDCRPNRPACRRCRRIKALVDCFLHASIGDGAGRARACPYGRALAMGEDRAENPRGNPEDLPHEARTIGATAREAVSMDRLRSHERGRFHRRSKHLDQDPCGTRADAARRQKSSRINKMFPGQTVRSRRSR